MNGFLLVDKPAGMTSHDVVDRIRKAASQRRVGHTGTLDPAATGLLIICLGKATRLSEHLTRLDKTYEGVLRLGLTTDSFDLDGAVTEEKPVPEVRLEEIQKACNAFVGDIEQLPPMVSAVKVGGERLYKKARKGETVERKPRAVTVHEYSVLDYLAPDARVRVRCTSGTYVRSLCHDVGQGFGCGGVLASLRRTAVGPHAVDAATPLDELQDGDAVVKALRPMGEALTLPTVMVRAHRRDIVLTGGVLSAPDLVGACEAQEGWVQIKSEGGELVALGQIERSAAGPRIHAKRVFVEQ
jgi:tRNA pseudouridine55 synthase